MFQVVGAALTAVGVLWHAPVESKWDRYIQQAADRWEKVFGKLAPLDAKKFDRGFFNAFYFINPQPESAFSDLDDKVLSPALLDQSQRWVDIFLRKDKRPKPLSKQPPQKYYLPKMYDGGLLLHEWKAGKYAFKMYESGNGMLLRILPSGHKPGDSFSAKELAAIIRDVLNVDYASAEKVIEGFKLPETVKPGEVFYNMRRPNDVLNAGEWKHFILGLVSRTDVCLICYKSQGVRMAAGFDIDRFWLNRSLFKNDGKTIVEDPPNEDP
jgi:hypothetical protein